MHVCVYVNTVM